MKKVKVTIDGVTVEVPEGTTILEAAKKINKIIPTFCYHDKLPIFGGCRMCLVWDKKWKNAVIACGTKVYDGMEIETENEEVLKDRKFILEMLFTRHPLDCPICDKAGECDLQNWGTYYGPQNRPYEDITPFDKVRPEENWESDYLEFVSNRCVLCLRCVSVCENVNGAAALFQEERGFEILISPDKKPMDTESSCEFCGLCVDICPVGAILFKPFKYNARPWLLKETVTYCGMCSVNCPVAVDHDGEKIYRIRSTSDLQICAGAYLGYDIHAKNRLEGGLKNGAPISLEEGIKEITKIINENPEKTAIVVSPYSTNETFEIIKEIGEKTGVYLTSTVTLDTLPTIEGFKEETGKEYQLPTEEDIIKAKKIVVLGNDVANTNPVISYLFHKVYFEGREFGEEKEIFYMGESLDRLKKYNPVYKEVLNEELLNKRIRQFAKIDKDTVIVYSTTTLKGEKAYKFGKKLGRIAKKIVVLGNDIANTNPVISYLFQKVYFEGREFGEEKEIFYMGESLDRLKKYNPVYKEVLNEELLNKRIRQFAKIDKDTVIVYSTTSLKGEKAYKFGKKLGRIAKKTGAKVLIIPQERNTFGLINSFENLYYLPDILKKIENKEIENLILIGEDIVQHIEENKMKEVFISLKNISVITPFNDGLALSSHIALGSSLWFEEEGTVEGFYGKKEITPYRRRIQEKDILKKIYQGLETKEPLRNENYSISYYGYPYTVNQFIELWDFGYLSKRSDNLSNIKMKNLLKEEILSEED